MAAVESQCPLRPPHTATAHSPAQLPPEAAVLACLAGLLSGQAQVIGPAVSLQPAILAPALMLLIGQLPLQLQTHKDGFLTASIPLCGHLDSTTVNQHQQSLL